MSQSERSRNQTSLAAKPPAARAWYVVDAEGKVLGRLASRISRVLMGKHKPTYVAHADNGDYVVVLNADKVRLTGRKAESKRYYRNTGYPRGLRVETYQGLQKKKPGRAFELAVRRMLPKTKLGERMADKLKVYPGADHPHQAQNPVPLEVL